MTNSKFENFDVEKKIENLEKTIWDLKEKADKNLNSIATNFVAITKVEKTIDSLRASIRKLWGAIREIRESF
jgi:peptidoglycan hydrolase CwlO-like protein